MQNVNGDNLLCLNLNQQPVKNHVFEHSQSTFVYCLFQKLMLKCRPILFTPPGSFLVYDTRECKYM